MPRLPGLFMIRTAYELSAPQLHLLSGVHPNTIYLMEEDTDKEGSYTGLTLERLKQALRCTGDDLTGRPTITRLRQLRREWFCWKADLPWDPPRPVLALAAP